ncbi:ASCH domain-containing protein [uncultured Brevundimonas sp.]|uniref:ASCH domain-containing protein n=1 Tax=uncultured Brevundimonas sp. TaxID=213418 RepID=UPI0025F5407A|nr:ASCH domain-containing protein [uncultured Brevundimonas sp.]
MKVLLSIKPEFADRIFSGEKTFEFRKSVYKDRSVKTVVVYATQPVGRLVGEFDVADIMSDTPEKLWETTRKGAGISQQFFESYFNGRDCAFALKIENVIQYPEPVMPHEIIDNFVPPQSYMYVDDAGRRPSAHENETLQLL